MLSLSGMPEGSADRLSDRFALSFPRALSGQWEGLEQTDIISWNRYCHRLANCLILASRPKAFVSPLLFIVTLFLGCSGFSSIQLPLVSGSGRVGPRVYHWAGRFIGVSPVRWVNVCGAGCVGQWHDSGLVGAKVGQLA